MKRLSIVLFFALLGFGAWGWFRLNQPEPPMALTEPLRIDQGEIQGGVDPDNPEIQVLGFPMPAPVVGQRQLPRRNGVPLPGMRGNSARNACNPADI